ncbi:hypothetical protein G3I13_22640 [Streptomyces sp. SID6673]|nr:hypothetical protein [Streptomyces sp. SID11726]NEB27141.1 hypothetical protein [Streptomyces sp. SID6673]
MARPHIELRDATVTDEACLRWCWAAEVDPSVDDEVPDAFPDEVRLWMQAEPRSVWTR